MLEATCLRSKLCSIKYESLINRVRRVSKSAWEKPFTTIFSMMFCLQEETFVRTWPKFNLNSINCSWLKSTKSSWVLLTTNASSWRMEFSLSPMVILPSSKQVLFGMFFLVPLNFLLKIIDSYLLILFRWPTCTQWANINHGCSCGWWWMWNSLHNFMIIFTESWAGKKCLCSLLLITFIYCKLLRALKHFSLCIILSVPSNFFLFFSQVPLIPVLYRAPMMKMLVMTTRRTLSISTIQLTVMKMTTSPGKNVLLYSVKPQKLRMVMMMRRRKNRKRILELISFIVTIKSKSYITFCNDNSQTAQAYAHQPSFLESFCNSFKVFTFW